MAQIRVNAQFPDVSRLESSAIEDAMFQVRCAYGVEASLTWGSGLFLRTAYVTLYGEKLKVDAAVKALSDWWNQ